MKNQFRIPDDLQHMLVPPIEPPQAPPRRPLEHWKKKGYLGSTQEQPAHEVKVIDILPDVVAAAIAVVQAVREWTGGYLGQRDDLKLLALSSRLFASYPVSAMDWWGSKDRVPPARVSLLDLRWPDGCEALREAIADLQDIVGAPFAALLAENSDRPTPEEYQAVQQHLMDALPQMDELVCQMQRELEDLAAGNKVEEVRQRKEKVKVPTDQEILVYQFKISTGAKQEQLARLLATVTGRTMDQGTVSRSIQKVERFIEAGNVLPPISPELVQRAIAMDPKMIDMGPNLERRTPRQRRRRDDSSGSA
jgi:hypothetical protein